MKIVLTLFTAHITLHYLFEQLLHVLICWLKYLFHWLRAICCNVNYSNLNRKQDFWHTCKSMAFDLPLYENQMSFNCDLILLSILCLLCPVSYF